MPDYYPLISRAASKLETNTAEARHALYEHARAILVEQLRSRQPHLEESEIQRERSSLEDAISKVEKVSVLEPAPKHSEEASPGGHPESNSPDRIFEQSGVANGQPRGRITFSTGRRPNVGLFDSADASTILHLSGHEWLEHLIEDSAHPQASEALKADVATVLKWLGVERAKDISSLQHDKFACGFETYMMEGRAPSRRLAPVFGHYKEGLFNIYRATQALNAPLNDDMRGVFDRLLAKPEDTADWKAECGQAATPERSPQPASVDIPKHNAAPSPPLVTTAIGTSMSAARHRPLAEVTLGHKSQTTKLLYSSETIGCGATMQLHSGEICMVSVAQAGVLVRSNRGKFAQLLIGFFGAVLYTLFTS